MTNNEEAEAILSKDWKIASISVQVELINEFGIRSSKYVEIVCELDLANLDKGAPILLDSRHFTKRAIDALK